MDRPFFHNSGVCTCAVARVLAGAGTDDAHTWLHVCLAVLHQHPSAHALDMICVGMRSSFGLSLDVMEADFWAQIDTWWRTDVRFGALMANNFEGGTSSAPPNCVDLTHEPPKIPSRINSVLCAVCGQRMSELGDAHDMMRQHIGHLIARCPDDYWVRWCVAHWPQWWAQQTHSFVPLWHMILDAHNPDALAAVLACLPAHWRWPPPDANAFVVQQDLQRLYMRLVDPNWRWALDVVAQARPHLVGLPHGRVVLEYLWCDSKEMPVQWMEEHFPVCVAPPALSSLSSLHCRKHFSMDAVAWIARNPQRLAAATSVWVQHMREWIAKTCYQVDAVDRRQWYVYEHVWHMLGARGVCRTSLLAALFAPHARIAQRAWHAPHTLHKARMLLHDLCSGLSAEEVAVLMGRGGAEIFRCPAWGLDKHPRVVGWMLAQELNHTEKEQGRSRM